MIFRPTRLAYAASAILALSLSACSDVTPAFGNSPAAARANAEDLFSTFVGRFTNVQRSAKFEYARAAMTRHALTPATLYRDTAVWTAFGPDSSRTLSIDGGIAGSRYVYLTRQNPPAISAPGDAHHFIRLTKLADADFEWTTGTEMAFGKLSAAELGNIGSRLLGAAESKSIPALRQDYRTSFPRTTAALGRLFSLDSIRTHLDADGATTTQVTFCADPERLKAAGFPDFAAYLKKHISSMAYTIAAVDRNRVRTFETTLKSQCFTVHTRSYHGRFVPLEGPLHAVPDTLRLLANVSMKSGLFTLGFSNLEGELVVTQSGSERAWAARFTKEPSWKLPPTVRYWIRTPLRRPFEGSGTTLKVGFRDNPPGQSLLTRHATVVVRESAILRFLGKFGASMMGDFYGKAEQEETRFVAEVFAALRADLRALMPGGNN